MSAVTLDDHRRKNADVFVRHNAAVMIADKKLDADSLYWSLVEVLEPNKLAAMRFGVATLAHPRALQIMIERLIKGQVGKRPAKAAT